MALSADQIAQLWVSQGGDPTYARGMARIALRESGGRPTIDNRGTNHNGTVDWGLFQVNDVWRKDPVIGKLFQSKAILTPEGNAKAAVRIMKLQGPKAWATGTASIDQKFLGGLKGKPVSASAAPAAPAASAPAAQPSSNLGRLVYEYLNSSPSPRRI